MVVYTIQRRTNYNALSLRGVLQSAADFSMTMIAGDNHTLIKEATWQSPGTIHRPTVQL